VLDVNYAQRGSAKNFGMGGICEATQEEFFEHEEQIMQFINIELEAFRLFIALEDDRRKREESNLRSCITFTVLNSRGPI